MVFYRCCLWLNFQHHFDHFGNLTNCRRKHFLELSAQTLSLSKLSPDNHWSPFWALISKTLQNSLANFWLHYVAFPSLSAALSRPLLHRAALAFCRRKIVQRFLYCFWRTSCAAAMGLWALSSLSLSHCALLLLRRRPLSALCGYSPFHFILHILLWQPLASYIFYYYVCLSACGKYTPWPPLVPQCLPVSAPRSLPGLGQAKRWNARLERLVGLPRFTVRWLFEWWRRRQRRCRRAACKAHKAALWCQLPSNCHAQFELQAAKPMNVTGKCALNCCTLKCKHRKYIATVYIQSRLC